MKDFNASGKKITIGIQDASGESALQYFHGAVGNWSGKLPPAPFSIRFERPIFANIESTYDAPDGTTRAAGINGKLKPNPGPHRASYGSVQRFEAPEFLYLNKDLEELDDIGDINGDPDKVAYYRLRNLGYAIDGENVQGVERFFERTITDDIKVIWKWQLEYGVIIESAAGDSGAGNPDPGVGRFWLKKDEQFSAAIDTLVQNEGDGVRIRHYGLKSTTYPIGENSDTQEIDLDPQSSRAVTNVVNIQEPLRIQWLSAGQVRYRIRALSGGSEGASQFDEQAFVQRFAAMQSQVPNRWKRSIVRETQRIFGWMSIRAKSANLSSALYRTPERYFTLGDFTVPQGGDFSAVGTDISVLKDLVVDRKSGESAVARAWILNDGSPTNPIPPTPTEINWFYQPTVFRAIVPLGQALIQLLRVHLFRSFLRAGTYPMQDRRKAFLLPVAESPKGLTTGTPLRWDTVGKLLHPVHPGSNQIEWRDSLNSDQFYKIEVVSGYPDVSVALASELEVASGERVSIGGNYVWQTDMDPVAADFPAADLDAHYRHLFDTVVSRRPPTELDLSQTDEWAFQELTYSDRSSDATVSTSTEGTVFDTKGAGRSVLLFSRRPNPDEVADGNLDEETLAVRVIRSEPVVPILPDDPKLILGRRGLELGGGSALDDGAFGLIQHGANSVASFNPGSEFVVDFWLNADGLRTGDDPVTVLSLADGQLDVVLQSGLTADAGDSHGTVSRTLGRTRLGARRCGLAALRGACLYPGTVWD